MHSIRQQYQEKLRQQGAGEPAPAATKTTTPQQSVGGLARQQQNNRLMEVAMEEDLKALKNIRSKTHKVELKREQLVPKYKAFVESTMAANKVHSILSQYLVWLFDIGDIAEATKLGEYCLLQRIPLPERFRRTLPIYLADEVLLWSEQEWDAGRSPNPYFNNEFKRTVNDRNERPDELTAKYFRLAGLIAQADKRFDDAVLCLEAASERGAKVKTVLNKCKDAQAKQENQQREEP
ncbi:phage terminase small subunit [Endozoicomonas sp. YOMI1]|uniref:phage terminase small subunit n=1 Tax=Endozoicomonas sp. YOMI1 TaxID=2828739 RepID=UPI00214821BF|nr:phage terminase small subunit [Endozoicomonas sp. YOMI1]